MIAVALVNLVMGGYFLYDAFLRLSANQSLLIFDDYLAGFGRYIPVVLGISMIITSIVLLYKKSTGMLFLTYVNSFLVLLFYTPSVFYSGIKERYSPWILVFQFMVLIICTILLYTSKEQGKGRASILNRETYDEYRRSMKQFKPEEDPKKDLKTRQTTPPE